MKRDTEKMKRSFEKTESELKKTLTNGTAHGPRETWEWKWQFSRKSNLPWKEKDGAIHVRR